jgi:hypothetical protein
VRPVDLSLTIRIFRAAPSKFLAKIASEPSDIEGLGEAGGGHLVSFVFKAGKVWTLSISCDLRSAGKAGTFF